MVVALENCKGCVNKDKCVIREDYMKLNTGVCELLQTSHPTMLYTASVFIRCSKYETDYGKGLGM